MLAPTNFPRDPHHAGRDAALNRELSPYITANDKCVVVNTNITFGQLINTYGSWKAAPKRARERAITETWYYIDDVMKMEVKPQIVIVTYDGVVQTLLLSKQWLKFDKYGVIIDMDVDTEPNQYVPLHGKSLKHLLPLDAWGALFLNC